MFGGGCSHLPIPAHLSASRSLCAAPCSLHFLEYLLVYKRACPLPLSSPHAYGLCPSTWCSKLICLVQSQYQRHSEIRASLGFKISAATSLEGAIAGGRLYVAQDPDEELVFKDKAIEEVTNLKRFASKGPGVFVAASSLGSLEALLTFLKANLVPVRDFGIGPIRRQAIRHASRVIESPHPEFALILAFDVPVERDAKELAEREGVRIFSRD